MFSLGGSFLLEVLFNFLLEFIFIKNVIVGEGSHIAGELAVGVSLGKGQVSLESRDESLGDDDVKTFLKRTVLINELSGFNLISDMEALDSLADVLNGLDDLGGGGAGGQHVDDVELLFEKKLAGVGGVDEGTSLGFDANLVLFGLLRLLGEKLVFLDGERFLHGL